MADIVDTLLASNEPAIRWKVRRQVLLEDPDSRDMRQLRREVRDSPLVRALLAGQSERTTYAKWTGRHWVLITLADIGYPPHDPELEPIVAKTMATWLAPHYFAEYETQRKTNARAVPVMNGRHRRCGSQHGGALFAAVRLGLAAPESEQLVERLLHWQWPDGGWNCSLKPAAASSSVYETLLPMRGLAAYAAARHDDAARRACHRAAEVLLTRRLLFRRSNGAIIRSEWTKLHYPVYWYYDVLAAAKGLMEAGRLADDRCSDGLDMLEAKRLPGGGWAAESRYYRSPGTTGNQDVVDWGGAKTKQMNEWISADALAVLRAAGRL
ncbi:MAG TPA: hypothetical protein VKB59_02665 [Micromonosporaceae bacterium]|nr:hypothetical protein [Micromonosporaceae bacterium]